MKCVICVGDFPPQKNVEFFIPETDINDYSVGDTILVNGRWGYIVEITDREDMV